MKNQLINTITETVNEQYKKKYKDFDAAYILGKAGEKAATNVQGWISTGSTMLDLAISNRPHGGIAVGKVTELNGLEGSGKSLIGAHILANTQKKGGIAIYIDTESAVSMDFLKVIGIDLNKLIYIQLEKLEDIYDTIEKIINKIRSSEKDKLVTILVDSLSSATTENEYKGDYQKEGWNTDKAIINSKAMRKVVNMIARKRIALVVTQQLRTKLGVMFGDKYTVSGGLAVQFAASTRIRLTKALKIKDKNKEIIGLYIKARIDKSRFGPSYRQVEFPLYFTSGIDDAGSLLIYLKNKQLIKSSGAWYTLQRIDAQTNETEEIKFMAKDWKNKLYKDKSLQEYVYKLICDNFIMKYQEKEEPIDIDSLEIESDLEPEQPFEKLNSNNKDIE